MSFASASAEESPRVLAKLCKFAPGVLLSFGAKLACWVTSAVTVGLTPVALGGSNGTNALT